MTGGRTRLLSGIPRSGSSLVCRLAGELPDTVAISEPIDGRMLANTSNRHEASQLIHEFAERTRQRILAERRALSLHVAGRLIDNVVQANDTGLRTQQGERSDIRIDKALTRRFTLLIKHNALFAALLPELRPSFPCLALVRNPIAVLASWQTVALSVQRGRIPAGERFDEQLRTSLDDEPSILRRQIAILDWFFEQYRTHLPPSAILRYEDVTASNAETLFQAVGITGAPRPLANQNANPAYAADTMDTLLAALLSGPRTWRTFYTQADCEQTAAVIAARR